jgi:hypothetical protein
MTEKRLATICFRTGTDLREALERIAAADQRSLSQTIEMMLMWCSTHFTSAPRPNDTKALANDPDCNRPFGHP